MSKAIGHDGRSPRGYGAATWLGLAAAPAFAAMALLSGVLGAGKMAAVCGISVGPSWLGGMVPMYLLMSAFHSAPWWKLIAGRSPSRP